MVETEVRVWFWTHDADFAHLITRELGPGFAVRQVAQSDSPAVDQIETDCDVALLDARWEESDSSVIAVLKGMGEGSRNSLPPPVIAMLTAEDRRQILKLMEAGAYDTVTHPPNMVELRLILRRASKFRQVERELYQLRSQEPSMGRLQELVGASECMQRIFVLAQKIAPCDVNVMITGETGTGKELLARAIHRLSSRSGGPFVAFSCASLPETLIEDELFGHERGAFTGALMARRGRFEAADQGTLFLDEIGDLGVEMQAKLLRVLQARSFERIGSNTPVNVNIRLICATNKNLAEMVERGTFREDLYYRLNVVQIHLPSLRERRDDILFLAHYFLQTYSRQFKKKVNRFSRLALHALEEHHWRGNVRELENVIQRAVVLAEGSTIEVWHFPAYLRRGFEQPKIVHSYDEEVREFKRRLILRTLHECSWRKTETARALGMARGYLHRLINQLEIAPEPPSEASLSDPELPVPIRGIM